MKRKKSLPLPLELVKQFEKEYPECWDMVDYVRQGKGNDLPDWNDICFCPLAGTQAIMIDKYKEIDLNKASLLAALSSWRQYKEIYSFSDELKEVLYEQAEDILIPMDVLYSIPFPCIYIVIDENEGFFVFFEQDMNTFQMELRFCIVKKNNDDIKMFNTWIHLRSNYTISDGINEGIDLILHNKEKYKKELAGIVSESLQFGEEESEWYFEEVSKRFQLLLYICAENAEIEENPEQKQITRKPLQNSKPKDVYREIRSWNVGVKYAYNVRKAKSEENNQGNFSSHNTHSSHRPHTRRGHWHHYWTGTKDNRKLVLKWTAPIFVGGDSNNVITTINKK